MMFTKKIMSQCLMTLALVLQLLLPLVAQAELRHSGSGVEVQQQSFVWPAQKTELNQFLMSQQQLQEFSLMLIPLKGFDGDSRKVIAELKRTGIKDSQLQLRYDLKPGKKIAAKKNQADNERLLEVRIEWFMAKIRVCRADHFGCANRNNLMQMANPKQLVIAPPVDKSLDGISALKALEVSRENQPLERRTTTGSTIGN